MPTQVGDNMLMGISQFKQQTPRLIKQIRNGLNYFCGGVGVAIPWLAKITHTNPEDLIQGLGFFMLSFNTFAAFFGVLPEDNSTQK